jgi:hypothetical protein
MEEVQCVLEHVGDFWDFREVRHEGATTCVFATAENPAVYADVLSIPWTATRLARLAGGPGAPDGRATAGQGGPRGCKTEGGWQQGQARMEDGGTRPVVTRTPPILRSRARQAHLTATIEIELPRGGAGKVRALVGSTLAANWGTWSVAH